MVDRGVEGQRDVGAIQGKPGGDCRADPPGASVSDRTAAIGITSPSLYAAFGSKESLFCEAVALYDATDGAVTERALREEPTARGTIEAMLRGNAIACTDKPRGCMIVLAATT